MRLLILFGNIVLVRHYTLLPCGLAPSAPKVERGAKGALLYILSSG